MPTKYAGGFTSQRQEIALPSPPTTGEIPDWLSGTLVRTAPSQFETERKSLNHWFDGYAMLHQFDFSDGTVSYRNRFVESAAYRSVREKGRMTRGEFATDPCRSLFGYLMSLFSSNSATDNPNVSVNKIGERWVAMTETPLPIVFDPDELATEGEYPYSDDLDGFVTVAHPHFDHAGNLYSYLLDFGYQSRYQIYRQAPGSTERELIAEIPSQEPAYVHSFGFTERYIVLAEFPFVVNPLRLKFSGQPFIANYRWKPERGTRFHVIDRRGEQPVRTITGEPFFCFHHVNTYEADGGLIVDLVAYEDAGIIEDFYLENLRHQPIEATAELRRIRLDPDAGTATSTRLSDTLLELPRINYAYNGRPYRYLYAGATLQPGNFIDALVKYDLQTGAERRWSEEKTYPGEPVFVPQPDRAAEDAGVILSVVFDAQAQTSFLIVLDAATFGEQARVSLPQHIPFGFHGNYFPQDNPAPHELRHR